MSITHNYLDTAGLKPTAAEIEQGELAVNFADNMIWTKDTSGVVIPVGAGNVQNNLTSPSTIAPLSAYQGKLLNQIKADLNGNSSEDFTASNFITSGLVDGRDVSADGAKLDGIESGATADMSASEILTAIKTVDGAGSGLDADLLDGNSSSYFLPAASYTSSDVLAKIKTVDGAGSGLDADLLDGVQLSDIAKKTDYATSTVGGTVKMRLSGTTLYIRNDGTDA